jgi:DNA-binding MarR family transcriptional regulator
MLAAHLLFAVQRELKHGQSNLKPRHGAVMAYLDEEGSRATELAQLSGQHKQVIGTLVDELEALGFVRRVPDPEDRRAKLIVPTEKGLAHMKESDAILAALEERLAKALGEKDFETFKRLFGKVVEAAQET